MLIQTLIFSLAFVVKVTLSDACPLGWVDGELYGVGCLFVDHEVSRSWEETAIFCQQEKNATLLELQDYEQLRFMTGMLNHIDGINSRSYKYWTAGTDLAREGRWIWQGSLTPVPSEIWHAQFPMYGITHNCMELVPVYNFSFDMMDEVCLEKKFTICQKK